MPANPGGDSTEFERRDRLWVRDGYALDRVSGQTLLRMIEVLHEGVLALDITQNCFICANSAALRLLGDEGDLLAHLRPTDAGLELPRYSGGQEMGPTTTSGVLNLAKAPGCGGPRREIAYEMVAGPSDTIAVIVLLPDATLWARENEHRDPLTGLADRQGFVACLEGSLERESSGAVSDPALLFVDLDGFKQINDLWGHATGDKVLETIAKRLTASVRPEDLVARYGGDEFTVLLEAIHPGAVVAAAKRLLARIAEPVVLDGESLLITASLGIAMCDQQMDTAERALDAADRAMYQAKALGPGSYVVFDGKTCPPFPGKR